LALKDKNNKYRKATFSQKVKLENEFKFKTPTENELLKSQKSNRDFLEKERGKSRKLLGLSFLVVMIFLIFYFWLF